MVGLWLCQNWDPLWVHSFRNKKRYFAPNQPSKQVQCVPLVNCVCLYVKNCTLNGEKLHEEVISYWWLTPSSCEKEKWLCCFDTNFCDQFLPFGSSYRVWFGDPSGARIEEKCQTYVLSQWILRNIYICFHVCAFSPEEGQCSAPNLLWPICMSGRYCVADILRSERSEWCHLWKNVWKLNEKYRLRKSCKCCTLEAPQLLPMLRNFSLSNIIYSAYHTPISYVKRHTFEIKSALKCAWRINGFEFLMENSLNAPNPHKIGHKISP